VANIKSQIKRNRQTIVRTERNKAVRSELKTRTKNASVAATEVAENAAELVRAAQKRIDSAASKGVIHKNAAARRKSRLAKKLNHPKWLGAEDLDRAFASGAHWARKFDYPTSGDVLDVLDRRLEELHAAPGAPGPPAVGPDVAV